jgi:hypothetical protein
MTDPMPYYLAPSEISMRTNLLALLCVLSLAGCPIEVIEPDGGTPPTDGPNCPSLPDLMPQPPKCAAAEGLPGNNIVCVDFKDVASPPSIAGWDFVSNCPNGWETAGNPVVLQVANHSSFTGNCGVLLPSTDPASLGYSKLVLSVIHHVDIDPGGATLNQIAQIFFDSKSVTRLLLQTNDSNLPQQTTITIKKADLPAKIAGSYRFLLNLYTATSSSRSGWQISSIAVNGVQ